MFFEKIAEEKIREATEKGEFDNLGGKGKPIDLDSYFATPSDLRLGYSVLKSAGCVPEEVELRKEIETLKESIERSDDPAQRHQMEKEVEAKTLKLGLLTDSNRRARKRGG
jgi:hypothetical protein